MTHSIFAARTPHRSLLHSQTLKSIDILFVSFPLRGLWDFKVSQAIKLASIRFSSEVKGKRDHNKGGKLDASVKLRMCSDSEGIE